MSLSNRNSGGMNLGFGAPAPTQRGINEQTGLPYQPFDWQGTYNPATLDASAWNPVGTGYLGTGWRNSGINNVLRQAYGGDMNAAQSGMNAYNTGGIDAARQSLAAFRVSNPYPTSSQNWHGWNSPPATSGPVQHQNNDGPSGQGVWQGGQMPPQQIGGGTNTNHPPASAGTTTGSAPPTTPTTPHPSYGMGPTAGTIANNPYAASPNLGMGSAPPAYSGGMGPAGGTAANNPYAVTGAPTYPSYGQQPYSGGMGSTGGTAANNPYRTGY